MSKTTKYGLRVRKKYIDSVYTMLRQYSTVIERAYDKRFGSNTNFKIAGVEKRARSVVLELEGGDISFSLLGGVIAAVIPSEFGVKIPQRT